MPEWAKVLAGSFALLIGASAPSLIVFALNPSLFIPTLLSPSAPLVSEIPKDMADHEACQECQKYKNPESFYQRATGDPIAIATIILALATAGLAYAGWQTAKDTRRALILAQRPYLRIRNVVIRVPQRPFGGRIFHPGELITGQLYIVIVGGTEARLFEAHCEVYWTNAGVHTLPMERPYEGQNPNIPNLAIVLEPGEATPFPFGSDRQIGERESDQILEGSLSLYVLGFAGYADQLGIRRRTAFCRKYDHVRRRFFPVEETDYEHEE
jgi:hypothetical protein